MPPLPPIWLVPEPPLVCHHNVVNPSSVNSFKTNIDSLLLQDVYYEYKCNIARTGNRTTSNKEQDIEAKAYVLLRFDTIRYDTINLFPLFLIQQHACLAAYDYLQRNRTGVYFLEGRYGTPEASLRSVHYVERSFGLRKIACGHLRCWRCVALLVARLFTHRYR